MVGVCHSCRRRSPYLVVVADTSCKIVRFAELGYAHSHCCDRGAGYILYPNMGFVHNGMARPLSRLAVFQVGNLKVHFQKGRL